MRTLSCSMQTLSCGMQTLSCGMHVGSSSPARDRTRAPPALGAWSPTHWTTREVPEHPAFGPINPFHLWSGQVLLLSQHSQTQTLGFGVSPNPSTYPHSLCHRILAFKHEGSHRGQGTHVAHQFIKKSETHRGEMEYDGENIW